MRVIDSGSAPGARAGHARLAWRRAVRDLLGMQRADGSWQEDPPIGVPVAVRYLVLREILGVADAGQRAVAAALIRREQRPDGSWGGDLAVTVLAYLVLRLAGDPPEACHMALAAGWIRQAGGLFQADPLTRIWLTLAGAFPWDGLPLIPPEVIYLPGLARPGTGTGGGCPPRPAPDPRSAGTCGARHDPRGAGTRARSGCAGMVGSYDGRASTPRSRAARSGAVPFPRCLASAFRRIRFR